MKKDRNADLYRRFRERVYGRKLFWIPMILLVATVFSLFVFLTPAEGGEATFLSMAIIALAGYIYGPSTGFVTALIFGVIMFFLHGQVPEINFYERFICEIGGFRFYLGEVADYVGGYLLMGAAGFFCPAKRKGCRSREGRPFGKEHRLLLAGFTLGAFLRFLEGAWNCWYFYTPMYESAARNLGYCISYSFWYIGMEYIVSLIVLLIPPVFEAIEYVRISATQRYYINHNHL